MACNNNPRHHPPPPPPPPSFIVWTENRISLPTTSCIVQTLFVFARAPPPSTPTCSSPTFLCNVECTYVGFPPMWNARGQIESGFPKILKICCTHVLRRSLLRSPTDPAHGAACSASFRDQWRAMQLSCSF